MRTLIAISLVDLDIPLRFGRPSYRHPARERGRATRRVSCRNRNRGRDAYGQSQLHTRHGLVRVSPSEGRKSERRRTCRGGADRSGSSRRSPRPAGLSRTAAGGPPARGGICRLPPGPWFIVANAWLLRVMRVVGAFDASHPIAEEATKMVASNIYFEDRSSMRPGRAFW